MAEEPAAHVSRAILILNVQDLEQIAEISSPINIAATRTRTRLLIVIFSPAIDNVSPIESWDAVQTLLTHTYLQVTRVSQLQNKILMCVDVLLRGVQVQLEEVPMDDWDTIFHANVSGGIDSLPIPRAWLSLPHVHLLQDESTPIRMSAISHTPGDVIGYPVVALGGTFDHLHAGHKILLSMAAWITTKKIIVGVTDDALLVKKVHKELLESIATRVESVRNFLRLFKPGLIYDVVPINDVYGPTGWDADIQALVVSRETISGADAITSFRADKSLPPLKTFVIDVISHSSSISATESSEVLKNAKMSSTFIRQWIYDRSTI